MKTAKLEDITSKEFLDKALKNAKLWCQNNLSKYLQDFQNGVDYGIFCYILDNKMIGSDMRLDENQQGLVRVSTRKLKWHQKREELFRKYDKLYGKIREPVEVDPESTFIHEITEWIILNKLGLLNQPGYISNAIGVHSVSNKIENINRIERGLREWPEY